MTLPGVGEGRSWRFDAPDVTSIVVDSSVWIGNLRDDQTEAVRKLRALDLAVEHVVVPDLVLMEVLRGASDEVLASRIERGLRRFEIARIGGDALAVEAARHHRHLRRLGVTVRGGIDLLIGTFCIAHGCVLLHHARRTSRFDDRTDFAPMQRHLGLRCL